jgi:glutathione peroxidase
MSKQALFVLAAFSLLAVLANQATAQTTAKGGKNVLQFKMKGLDGKAVDLAKYKGKVVLIVNVASECGYTPQYKPLQALHAKYAKEGLAVLGFPCNDFGKQEPGTEKQIAEFCEKNYGVTFDMFAKISIKGEQPAPLFKFLTSKETNPKFSGPVRWNFTKFLIGRDGSIVARFESDVDPESDAFQKAIRDQLAKK